IYRFVHEQHSLLYQDTIYHESSSTTLFFFFFNDPAPTEIYTLSLHDALPISPLHRSGNGRGERGVLLLSADAVPAARARRGRERHRAADRRAVLQHRAGHGRPAAVGLRDVPCVVAP